MWMDVLSSRQVLHNGNEFFNMHNDSTRTIIGRKEGTSSYDALMICVF